MRTPTDTAAPHLAPTKAALRRAAIARRDRLPPADAADRLAAILDAHLPDTPAVLAGTWPIGSEIDPRPAMLRLHARGARLALPETPPPGTPLRFRLWNPGEPLLPGRCGTRQPAGALVTPDLLLVPLLAFDHAGHRLGYGGGYYDRTLAALPQARAIGCAYAAQHLDALPAGPYDIRLHAIATEQGVIIPKA